MAPSALIRIEDEPPSTRLDYLRHTLASTIAPFDMRQETDRPIRASIHAGQIGTVAVTKVIGERFDARRTPGLIRVSDPELFKIDVQLRGRTVYAQSGRQAALLPGDFTLVDLSRPSRVHDVGDVHEVVAVKFAHAALPLRHDELARLTAVRVPGHDGLGAA